MSSRVLANPQAGTVPAVAAAEAPLAFHRRLPGYAPTPLIQAPSLARHLGLHRIWIKDESRRLGLPSFKILGASWAIYRALSERQGREPGPWHSLADLALHLAPPAPLTLVAATDGNHGRAVARMATLLGLQACILVPAGTAEARVAAIAAEGAAVEVVEGTYDEAVLRSAALADTRHLVISDTSWPGYRTVPGWVIEGYATICAEVDEEPARRGEPGLDLVVVQIGVGALAAAVARHYRRPDRAWSPAILGVEPTGAACLLASIAAGEPVSIAYSHDSIMAGLNCGTPSQIAWPAVRAGIDVFIAIDDEWTRHAMRALAEAGVVAGETGAAGLGGLLALLTETPAESVPSTGTHRPAWRSLLKLGPAARVLILSTEGATDPDAYGRILDNLRA